MKQVLLIIFTCTALVQASVLAQVEKPLIRINVLNQDDGLSYRNIRCVHQDSRGILWLGTQHGLVKYDGTGFSYFNKDNSGLNDNEVFQILEDESGILWLVTYHYGEFHRKLKAVTWFDPTTEAVVEKDDLPKNWSKRDGEEWVDRISSSAQHKIVFIDAELNWQNYIPGKGILPSEPRKRKDFTINPVLYEYSSNSSQLSVEKYFFELGFPEGTRWRYNYKNQPSTNAYVLSCLAENKYLVATDEITEGLGIWIPGKEVAPLVIPIPLKIKLQIPPKFREHDGTIWFSGEKSLFVYSIETGFFLDFRKKHPAFFEATGINEIKLGKRNEVFVCTSNGLYIIESQKNPFSHFLSYEVSANSPFYEHSCRGISKRGDTLFVTHDSGLFSGIDPNTGEVKLQGSTIPFIPLLVDRDHLLIYSDNYHLEKWWPESGKRELVELTQQIDTPWSIEKINDSLYWMGSRYHGLLTCNWLTGDVFHFKKTNGFEEIRTSSIYNILKDSEKVYYLATSKGIYTIHLDEGIIGRYWTGGKDENYFPFDDTFFIHKKEAGVYWVSTNGGGIIKWIPEKGEVFQYTMKDGLAANIVYGIFEDEEGILWMPSYQGICSYDETNQQFINFTDRDGLSHNEFNRSSYLHSDDGRMFFGGLNGVNAFYPSDLKRLDREAPPMLITSFLQYDVRTLSNVDGINQINENQTFTIEPYHIRTSIEVTLLDYINPELPKYEYKLEGEYNTWQEMNGNLLELGKLPYGQHTLVIRGQIKNQFYPPQYIRLTLNVVMPFYFTWWFILGSILLATFFVSKLNEFRKKRIAKQKALLEEKVETRAEVVLDQKKQMEKDRRKIVEQTIEIQSLGKFVQSSSLKQIDRDWLAQLDNLIEHKMSDSDFMVGDLAGMVHMSRSKFTRKLKKMTGLTPGAWLREARLQRAKLLLENGEYESIKIVAYEVGINPRYFAAAYYNRFGILPSEVNN